MSHRFDFKGEILVEAIEKTFKHRKTTFTSELSIFNPSFMKDAAKQSQWQGFIKKTKLNETPASFEGVAADIKAFLQPVLAAIFVQQTFNLFWAAPGPWR